MWSDIFGFHTFGTVVKTGVRPPLAWQFHISRSAGWRVHEGLQVCRLSISKCTSESTQRTDRKSSSRGSKRGRGIRNIFEQFMGLHARFISNVRSLKDNPSLPDLFVGAELLALHSQDLKSAPERRLLDVFGTEQVVQGVHVLKISNAFRVHAVELLVNRRFRRWAFGLLRPWLNNPYDKRRPQRNVWQ